MRRSLRAKLLASALVFSAVPLLAATFPVQAQEYGEVSFDSFHGQLERYGYWLYSDRWGLVWQPADVPYDFRPYYTGGHWVYTDDYGWYWLSDLPWGDIAFHYGRWVNDPDDGWLWIPGYTWSPGWVVWRTNGEFVGWMPAPPDEAFLEGRGDVSFGVSFGFGGGRIAFNWDNDPFFGYRRWYGRDFDERRFANNWVFVNIGHIDDRDYRPFVVRDPVRVINIIHNTRNITNYTVVNNYVVNRSVDVRMVERAAGHPVRIAPARMVIRAPSLVTRVDVGQRIMMREREIAPRGMGIANSAPPPPAAIVNRLSINVTPRNGRPAPTHLFTRSTIAQPEVQGRFKGMPGRGNTETGPANMGGPGAGNAPESQGPAGIEGRRRGQGNPAAEPGMAGTPSGSQTAPGASGNPPESTGREPARRHPEQGPPAAGSGTPGAAQGTIGGANGDNGPTGQSSRRRTPGTTPQVQSPEGASGGQMGPGEQGQTGGTAGPDNQTGTPRRRHAPGMAPEGQSPAGAAAGNPDQGPGVGGSSGGEMRHEGRIPGSMTGPQSPATGGPAAGTGMPQRSQPGAGPQSGSPQGDQGSQTAPVTKKKPKQPNPDQPPQNPQ